MRALEVAPKVQFGHPAPDGRAYYRQVLINRFQADTPADIAFSSLNLWPTFVQPQHLVVHPGVTNTLAVTITVPLSPTQPTDLEMILAMGGLNPVVTSTGYLITIAQRHPFTDVPEGFWADDPLQYLVGQGVVSGYADGTFHPNDYVTRAQFAKMLTVAMGWPIQSPGTPSFGDMPRDSWAYGYVETAVAHGAINGYADGTFRPYAGVTRGQVAKMIALARGWTMEVRSRSSFTDIAPGEWVSNYAEMANSATVMTGYSDSTFRPYSTATRAQVAKILTLSLFSEPGN
jgi:S-layer family protein